MTRDYDIGEIDSILERLRSVLTSTQYSIHIPLPPVSMYDSLPVLPEMETEVEDQSESEVYENSEELDSFLKEFALKEVR